MKDILFSSNQSNIMWRTDEKFFLRYYKTDFKILRLIGAWLISEDTKNKAAWQFYLLTINVSFALLINLLQILHIFEFSSLVEVTSSGFLITIALMGSIKTYYIFKNKKDFLLLIDYMQEKEFLPKNPKEQALAMESLSFHRKVKYVLLIICTAAIAASMATPIFSYRERKLLFSAWYPFDLAPLPVYILVYVHQTIADFYISYMNVYLDIVVAGFTTFIGIQCDLLCYNLTNMQEDTMEVGLKECIRHHELILR